MRHLLLLIFFGFLWTGATAQNLDSLVSAVNSNPGQSLKTAQRWLRQKKTEKKELLYFAVGKAYRYLGDLDSASHYLYRALEKEETMSEETRVLLYLETGIVLKQKYQTALALPYYQKGMELAYGLGDQKNYNRFLNNIGRIYYERGDLTEATYFYQKALDNESPENLRSIAIRLHNLGAVFEARNELDSAMTFYNRALKGYEAVDDSVLIAYGYASIARIHKNRNEAIRLIDESIRIRERMELKADLEESLIVKATILYREKRYNEALDILQRVEQLQPHTGHKNILLEVLRLKADIYTETNDVPMAFQALRQYLELKDAVDKEETDQIIAGINSDFKFRQKNREIEFLQERDDLNQKVISQKDRALELESQQKWGVVLILTLALGGIVLMVVFIRKMRRQNAMIAEQRNALAASNQEKEVLLKEVNHRVKNNLQIASGIIRRGIDAIDDPKAKDVIRNNITRIDTIALIHDTIYRQENLSRIDVTAYIRDLAGKLIDANADDREITVSTDEFQTALEAEQMIHLGHLITEVLLNSLKYVQEDPLVMHIAHVKENGADFLNYSDNGKHFDVAAFTESTQFGNRLIQSSVRKLTGESPYIYEETGFHLRMNISNWYHE